MWGQSVAASLCWNIGFHRQTCGRGVAAQTQSFLVFIDSKRLPETPAEETERLRRRLSWQLPHVVVMDGDAPAAPQVPPPDQNAALKGKGESAQLRTRPVAPPPSASGANGLRLPPAGVRLPHRSSPMDRRRGSLALIMANRYAAASPLASSWRLIYVPATRWRFLSGQSEELLLPGGFPQLSLLLPAGGAPQRDLHLCSPY